MRKILYGEKWSVIIDDIYYNVIVVDELPEKLKKGNAYHILGDDYVLPYKGKATNIENEDPGIYKTNNGYEVVHPFTEEDMDKYGMVNIVSYDPGAIFNDIDKNKDNFINVEDIEVINNNSDVYCPAIAENDDPWKVAIKTAIQNKQINLSNYKDKFGNAHALTNTKSTMRKNTKMTVTNFIRLCEVLGLDWTITLTDNGEDKISPLKEPVVVSSKNS